MADTSSQSEPLPAPHTNGLDGGGLEQQQQRPADIDADMREMERRKRVELIMNSRLFREELERIIETQMKDGGAGTSHLLQQISDMMGVPKHANAFKGSNCVMPINDIRGVESMGYAKGEKLLRCKLAAVYRLLDLYGWAQGVSNQVTARLNQDQEHFVVNPYGMLCHEITASSLVKIDMQGNVVETGTTNFGVNVAAFSLHAAIHAARPDVKCAIHVHTPAVMAVSALKCGLLPISQESVVIGDVSTHPYAGGLAEPEEREKVARNLGPINKVLLLANHGAVCCGETVEEAFFNVYNTIVACETQLKLMPVGIDNLALVSEETRKQMYEAARRAPDGTNAGVRTSAAEPGSALADKLAERKWRVGGVEFEALMRMLDNAGFRTGYIYRNPLIKGDPPRPRNDVEVPPAVSSLGYLLEEEEMYKQGIWKPGRKGNDRTRWLNSPNVYQKVEILETGTPDPKKITKWVDANADEWVADGSPTHSSTPVKIDAALQFVPKNTNPKEFKLLQQQIKDNRRADKISAGPQSHILEGVTWEEAKKMQDAGVTQTGDQVVVVGAASKGIIQRGFQHHAMVYKAPYAKNPFDSVTDEELDEYKKVIEKKAKGEYDTDYSESEGLSSAQISKQVDDLNLRSPTSATSETEEESRDEPRVLRIETKQAPKPSQPEVVLSDESDLSTLERRKPPIPPRKRDDEHVNANMLLLNAERHQAQQTAVNSNQKFKGSNKSLKTGVPACYRTTSYAGMPRGCYAFPKPKHFHIACFDLAEMRAHPLFVRFSKIPQSNTLPIRHPTLSTQHDIVTININSLPRSLSIDIPLHTIRDFIEPFNKILNYINEKQVIDECLTHRQDNNSIADTEQHYEYDITDQPNDERSVLNKQRDSVMRDINSNVALLDLDTSFSDLEVVDLSDSENSDHQITEGVINFAKKITKYKFDSTSEQPVLETVRIWEQEVETNNNQIEHTLKNHDKSGKTNYTEFVPCDSNKVDDKKIDSVIDLQQLEHEYELVNSASEKNTDRDSNIYEIIDREYSLSSNNTPEKSEGISNGGRNSSGESILKSFLEISQGYDKIIAEHGTQANASINTDYGQTWTDKSCITAIKLMSRRIYKFIMQVCVETIESLEFPEVRCYHDAEDFFDSILLVYEKYMDHFPSENDMKALKQCIMNSVLKCLEKYFFIIPVTKDNTIDTKIANRKFLALRKFLSVITYILFDKIENPDFQCTHYEMPELNGIVDLNMEGVRYHSTPEGCELYYTLSESSDDRNENDINFETNSDSSSVSAKNPTNTELPKKPSIYSMYERISVAEDKNKETITSFLSKKSDTTGNLKYWIMLNDNDSPRKRRSSLLTDSSNAVAEKIRRLSAPARFMSDITRTLSPITEEPRRSLLWELSQCEDYNYDPSSSINSPIDTNTVTLSNRDADSEGSENLKNVSSNVFFESLQNLNNVSSSTTTSSSAVNKQEESKARRRIIFQNEVTFVVSPNAKTNYDATKSVQSVTFLPNDENLVEKISSVNLEDTESISYISANSVSIEPESTDDGDGDWMGYEAARF